MILEMDVGNSRIKWRLLDAAGSVAERGVYESNQPWPLGARAVSRARVASVAGAAVRQRLASEIRENMRCEAEFASTSAACAGVVNSYPEPARMGVDRWLAMLAAWRVTRGPVVVVDAGTAITVDGIDGQGRHVGGYILPGLALLQRSLQQETREVRCTVDPIPTSLAPGHTTGEAVGHGIHLMALAAIREAVSCCQASAGQGAVLFCGGDAVIMQGHLPVDWCHEPDLVLDGLAIALP